MRFRARDKAIGIVYTECCPMRIPGSTSLGLCAAVAVVIASGGRAAAESPDPFVRWLNGAPGYKEAAARHERSGTPLWLYFYTDWCGYCRQLNTQVLASPDVDKALNEVVAVRINPDRGPQEKALAEQFGVTGYPSFFVVGEGATESQRIRPHRQEGGQWVLMSPAEFVAECGASAEKPRGKWMPRAEKIPAQPAAQRPVAPKSATLLRNQVTLHLTGGQTVTGELLRESPDAVTLRWEYGEVDFQRAEFTGMTREDAPAAAAPESPAGF